MDDISQAREVVERARAALEAEAAELVRASRRLNDNLVVGGSNPPVPTRNRQDLQGVGNHRLSALCIWQGICVRFVSTPRWFSTATASFRWAWDRWL